jgi:hypothetical protein
MFDVADSLRGGLNLADRKLQSAQNEVAQAGAGHAARATDAAMAATAQAVIFQQALLGAIHARLQELKAVSK